MAMRQPPGITHIEGPITPGPHAEFCDLLQDQIVERLALLQGQPAATNE